MLLAFILQSSGSSLMSFLPLLMMLVVIYFFFMRPQMKKQKEQGLFIDNIQKGDEIVLSSGIIGRVNKIEDNIVQIQTDQKNYLRVLKASVSREMTEALNTKDTAKT